MWRKAPFQLLFLPKLLAALTLGVLLTSFVAAGYEFAMSATTNHLLEQHLDDPQITRYGAGIAYWSTDLSFRWPAPGQPRTPLYLARQRAFARAADRLPYLGRTAGGVLGPTVAVSQGRGAGQHLEGRLFAGTQALRHVKVLSGPSGRGVWLAGFEARILGLHVGDRASIGYQNGRAVTVRIAGTYEALKFAPHPGYWRLWGHYIYKPCDGCPESPPFILLDRRSLIRLSEALRVRTALFGWAAPVGAGLDLTLDQARELRRGIDALHARLTAPHSALHELMDCCHTYNSLGFRRLETHFSTSLPSAIHQAEVQAAATTPSARLIEVSGVLVALLVVAAAGAFSAATRRVEMALLDARGFVPAIVGARSAIEAGVPSIVGGGLGMGAAALGARTIGDGAPLSESAIWSALFHSALAVIGAVILFTLVTAVAYARQAARRIQVPPAATPIVVGGALGAAALLILRGLRHGGAFGFDRALHVRTPTVGSVLFPLLLLGGFAAVGSALLRWGARAVRRRSDGFAPPSYLAVHRLAAATGVTAALFVAAAMCLGVFVYAETLGRSISQTVEAKAKTFVGSDVSATTTTPRPVLPANFPLPVTEVSYLPQAGTFPDGRAFDLLAIDPGSFANVAYWNRDFAPEPLNDLVGRVRARPGRAMPIIVSQAAVRGPLVLGMAQRRLDVRVVGTTRSFPGTSSPRPLVVLDRFAIARIYGLADPLVGPPASTMMWVKGDPARAEAALRRSGIPSSLVVTAPQVKEVPEFVASLSALHVLEALGLAAAVLVIGGLLMYLQSRERSQLVTFGLSHRMGLSRSRYGRSLALELGAILVLAYVVASGLGTAASRVMVPLLDPLGDVPPSPVFLAPVLAMVALGALLVGLAVAWGRVAARSASRADFGEVMRVAD